MLAYIHLGFCLLVINPQRPRQLLVAKNSCCSNMFQNFWTANPVNMLETLVQSLVSQLCSGITQGPQWMWLCHHILQHWFVKETHIVYSSGPTDIDCSKATFVVIVQCQYISLIKSHFASMFSVMIYNLSIISLISLDTSRCAAKEIEDYTSF